MADITTTQRAAGIAVDHENKHPEGFYPTPPAATKALLSVETFSGKIWEPACGNGAISKVLEADGHEVISTDLIYRGYGQGGRNFLNEWIALAPNIITNPPFDLSFEFIDRAVSIGRGKVALLMRLQCLAGQERKKLYDRAPPARVWVISNRIQMLRNGEPLEDGQSGGIFDFAWFVWDRDFSGPTMLGWVMAK